MAQLSLRDEGHATRGEDESSRLIAQAAAGEEVIIARGDTPVARLVPILATARRAPGTLRGLVQVDDAFFEPLPDAGLAAWNGA